MTNDDTMSHLKRQPGEDLKGDGKARQFHAPGNYLAFIKDNDKKGSGSE